MTIENETQKPIDLPILDQEFKANPHTLYDRLRKPGHSVVPVRLPTGVMAWLVTGYSAARQLLRDARLSKDASNSGRHPAASGSSAPGGNSHAVFQHLLMKDPPVHTRLRALLVKEFSTRSVLKHRLRIAQIAAGLLDDIAPAGKTNLIESFAVPLPLEAICEIVGIPAADMCLIRPWSSALLQADLENPGLTHDIAQEIFDYMLTLADAKRREQDGTVYCKLVNAMDQGELSREELAAMGFVLIFAGYETTANFIGNGIYTLLRNRPYWSALCSSPDLVRVAVEELLRLESPLEVATRRFAMSDIEIENVRIRTGDTVFIGLAAANRDPLQFACPHDPGFDRQGLKHHIAFGHGIHYCIGAELARLQGEVAFSALMRRFPDLELDAEPGDLEWIPGLIMRGLQSLPVRFSPQD